MADARDRWTGPRSPRELAEAFKAHDPAEAPADPVPADVETPPERKPCGRSPTRRDLGQKRLF